MQTLTVIVPPPGPNVFLYVNGKVYIPNESPGVTWVPGELTISWDETITGYLVNSNDDIKVR